MSHVIRCVVCFDELQSDEMVYRDYLVLGDYKGLCAKCFHDCEVCLKEVK